MATRKEEQEILKSIQSIQERVNQLNRENAGIVREIADQQDMVKQAQLVAAAEQSKNLADSKALANIDAIRAIQAQAIADGTLDTFDAVTLMNEALTDVGAMSEEVLDFVIQQADKMEEITKEMQQQDIFGESIASRMKDANDAAKENSSAMKDVLNSAGLIVDELLSFKTLVLAAVAGLATATKEAFKLARALGDGNTMLDTMKIVGVQLEAQFNALGRGFMLSGEEARASISALVDLNGSLADANAAAVTTVGEMSVKYGISADAAANLNKQMLSMAENSQEGADALMNQVKNLAKAKGVAPKAVMSDIADNAFEFARFGKDGASGLVNAAANAKKLGLNLAKVAEIGDNFLDIQGSIKAEMKAEMLLGRQLNLDAARAAAVAGDRDTLVKEIAKNAGTLAEFENMSVVEQRALAQALGASVPDVLKVLQAKEKGVNLDSKILEEQSKITDESANTAMQVGMIAQFMASTGGQILALMPGLAGMKTLFGGMIPKGGKLFGGLFGNAAQESADLSKKLEKVKAPKGGGGISNFFKGLSKIKASSIIKAALAIAIVAVALIPAAYAFSLLEGVDPVAMAVFGASMIGISLALAVVGSVGPTIIMGAAALLIVALALIPAAFAMSMLAGVDPVAMIAFAGAIGIIALATAGLGLIAPLAILGAVALILIGAATVQFAKAFSMMSEVKPEAINILSKGIKKMINIVDDLGLVQAGKLIIKAAALKKIANAVLPFGKAIAAAGKGNAKSLLQAVKGFAKIDTGGMAMAAMGLKMLAVGLMAFIPVFPFMEMMANSFALLIPQLEILAPLGEQLQMAGMGMLGLGYGMLPFAIGLMIAAPFLPLMPLLAEGIERMTPPLIELSTIAALMPLMGFGMMMLGFGLNSLGMGLMMVFPFQAVLPILAQALIDMQPPLSILAPLGPQIMYLAQAIGALGFAMGFAFYPVFAFGMAAYFTAPAVYLLGEASKVLGAGLEAVRVPLIAMAQQFPIIMALAGSITMLGMSLLFATPGVISFGAGAYFAMIPVLALAAGLSLMVSTAGGLTTVGTGLKSIAEGLAAVSEYKGTIALLAVAAPALALLGGTGLVGGAIGGGNNEGQENNEALIAKIDELIAVIDSKDYEPVLQIDGRKVGTAVARKRAPRGMGT